MSGPAVAARIRAGVARGSVRLSADGEPLVGTITRRSGADETVVPPVSGTPKDYMSVVGLSDYSDEDRMNSEISRRDVKVMVTRPVVATDGEEIEPSNGDVLSVGGVTYSIINVTRSAFAGYAVKWTCQCRTG